MKYSSKISARVFKWQGVHKEECDISGSGCVVALWGQASVSADVKGSLRTASPPVENRL